MTVKQRVIEIPVWSVITILITSGLACISAIAWVLLVFETQAQANQEYKNIKDVVNQRIELVETNSTNNIKSIDSRIQNLEKSITNIRSDVSFIRGYLEKSQMKRN